MILLHKNKQKGTKIFMDFLHDKGDSPSPLQEKHSEYMALASMILGITAVATSGCIYLAIVCGSLGIILAFLSRGGRMDFCTQAKVGLILGVIGLILTIFIYTMAFLFLLQQYGGIDGLMQEYKNLYHADTLEKLYQNMGIY